MDLFSILTGPVKRMSHVHRYSSFPVHRGENVAEHSWWVAFIAMLIAHDLNMEHGVGVSIEVVLERAIVHDLDECISGDIIRSFKYRTDAMRLAVHDAAVENMHEITAKMAPVGGRVYGAWFHAKADTVEGHIVRFADMASVVFYCREEYMLGNRESAYVLKELYETWFHEYHEHTQLGRYIDRMFPNRRFWDALIVAEPGAWITDKGVPMMRNHSEGETLEHEWPVRPEALS